MKHESNLFNIAGQTPKDLLRLLNAYRQAIDESIISSITDWEGTIIYANKKFCEVTKYSAEELIGQNHRIINSGYHPKGFFKDMWKSISNGNVWQNEVKNKAKDGTYYWVDTLIFPIKDDNGKVIQHLSLRVLINDKKQAEEQRNEHIKSLEEMLFMTSHEVRQPVANCLGLMNVIDINNPSKKDMMKIYSHIQYSANQLDAFTKKLTAFMYDLTKKHKKRNERLSEEKNKKI